MSIRGGITQFTILSILVSTLVLAQNAAWQTKPIDTQNMDFSVRPCDDFYQYANGNWLKHNPIPPAYSSWGSFTELAERNDDILHQILEDAANDHTAEPGSILRQMGDFFASGMDTTKIDSLGWRPIAEELGSIESLKDARGIGEALGHLHAIGAGGLFYFGSGQDLKNSTEVIGQLSQGGLGMPDRDYYLAADARSKKLRDEYANHVSAMFRLIGWNQEAANVASKDVMQLETSLAKASRTRVERRDAEKNYHRMTQEQLDSLTPAFSWNSFFVDAGWKDPDVVNVGQPEFFKEVNMLVSTVAVPVWKHYLAWKVVSSAAPYLSSAFVNEDFKFEGAELTGAKELQPRWRRVKNVIDRLMGEALGQLYVKKAFPPEAKARAMEMVTKLEQAMREHIQQLSWMDDATKAAALKKLNAFGVKIGYPDKWRDYSSVEIERDSYYGNVRRARAFLVQYNISKIGNPVDKTEWGMSPPTVNAYYSSTRNEIVFPAGILQPPFFNFQADDAVNYGGIGAVIGHEISHGFDDQGSKFDGDGNLKSWWTPQTRAQFEARTGALATQFDSYVAVDSLHVNGKLTLGENIGDLAGLSIAYTALENSLRGKTIDVVDGFTPEQRFFLSWAQVWRRNVRPEQLRLQVHTDPHSPSNFRTNGPLSDLDEFYEAFSCATDGKMYIPPAKRAYIWNY